MISARVSANSDSAISLALRVSITVCAEKSIFVILRPSCMNSAKALSYLLVDSLRVSILYIVYSPTSARRVFNILSILALIRFSNSGSLFSAINNSFVCFNRSRASDLDIGFSESVNIFNPSGNSSKVSVLSPTVKNITLYLVSLPYAYVISISANVLWPAIA